MRHGWWRLVVFLLCCVFPLFQLYLAWVFALGPDPGKVLVDRMGEGALFLLLATLMLSPLQALTGWSGWLAVRRQVGLWSFCYASLHMLAFSYFLIGFDLVLLGKEVYERPYVFVGGIAWLGLLALAMTSTRRSMQVLGRRWKRLHRLIYLLLLLALLHMLWVVRADAGQWSAYAGVGFFLLSLRFPAAQSVLREQGKRFRQKKRIKY